MRKPFNPLLQNPRPNAFRFLNAKWTIRQSARGTEQSKTPQRRMYGARQSRRARDYMQCTRPRKGQGTSSLPIPRASMSCCPWPRLACRCFFRRHALYRFLIALGDRPGMSFAISLHLPRGGAKRPLSIVALSNVWARRQTDANKTQPATCVSTAAARLLPSSAWSSKSRACSSGVQTESTRLGAR